MIRGRLIFYFVFSLFYLNAFSSPSDSTNTDTLKIIGVGDIMFGSSFPAGYLPPGNDCLPLIEAAIPYLQNADVTFGNLEGSFSNSCPVVKRCKDTTICFAFRMPEKYGECLTAAGFDVMSLANNHSGDFGYCAIKKTKEILDTSNIYYGGLNEHPTAIFTKDSVTYGFCAFSPNGGTPQITDYIYLKKIVTELDSKCDVVIISFHGGAEGAKYQHVKKGYETFYGENRGNVVEFAHLAIDYGADIIFGHGPHVTRAIDLYKDRFIIYSMGNFCTYGRFNLYGPNGIAPIIEVYTDKSGKFIYGNIIPIKQVGSGIVKIDETKAVITKLQQLTKTDFPELSLTISNEGIIKPE